MAFCIAEPVSNGVIVIPLGRSAPDVPVLVAKPDVLALTKTINLCFVDVLEVVEAPGNECSVLAAPVDHPLDYQVLGP